ncbi:hypothetical protein FACS1894203_0330 [Bacteroidia bacterium]|nr:hypothetical protein FACS1894203_0330 [Bacteroidia bacterium]
MPHGAIREIARRTNLTEGLISRFFNGKIDKSPQEPEILRITAEYLAGYKDKERKAKEALKAALKAV